MKSAPIAYEKLRPALGESLDGSKTLPAQHLNGGDEVLEGNMAGAVTSSSAAGSGCG